MLSRFLLNKLTQTCFSNYILVDHRSVNYSVGVNEIPAQDFAIIIVTQSCLYIMSLTLVFLPCWAE